MSGQLWSDATRVTARAILADLVSNRTVCYTKAPEIELKLRALGGSMDGMRHHRFGWRLMRDVIEAGIKTGGLTLEALEVRLAGLLERRDVPSEGLTRYRVFIPVQLDLEQGLSPPFDFAHSSVTLRFSRFTTWDALLGCAPSLENGLGVVAAVEPEPTVIAQVEVDAASADHAQYQGWMHFNRWRAAVNLYATLITMGVQFTPGARAAIPAPRWVGAVDAIGDTAVLKVRSLGPPGLANSWPIGLMPEHLSNATWMLNIAPPDANPGSTAHLLGTSTLLFTQAQDQPRWDLAFLLLWQLAEHLTTPEGERSKHRTVCKRFSRMSDESRAEQALVALALHDIKSVRNDVVHGAALWSVRDADTSFVERHCSNALFWLYRHASELPATVDLWSHLEGVTVET